MNAVRRAHASCVKANASSLTLETKECVFFSFSSRTKFDRHFRVVRFFSHNIDVIEKKLSWRAAATQYLPLLKKNDNEIQSCHELGAVRKYWRPSNALNQYRCALVRKIVINKYYKLLWQFG